MRFIVVTEDRRMGDPVSPDRFADDDVALLSRSGDGDASQAVVLGMREVLARHEELGLTEHLPPELVRQLEREGSEVIADMAHARTLVAQANQTFGRMSARCSALSDERCALIRRLRVEQRCTWRRVALECALAWGERWWEPASNQLAGVALCDAAARRFGEEFMTGMWN